MNSFQLLNTSIQEAIWDMGWKTFRPIQDQSIDIVINTDKDLIISAPTASGKTEAVFLPLISRYFNDLSNTLGILYISPLKALINDQFSRITTLCEKTNIIITKWHGDASVSEKKKIVKSPKGILMITPESIEALLIRKEIEARRLFNDIRCIVVDEIHSFLGTERGIHLYSLLNRIQNTTQKNKLRKIGLSATIGDLDSVKRWLSYNIENVYEIVDREKEKDVFGDVVVVEKDEEAIGSFQVKLFELVKHGKTLVFSNKKTDLEDACDKMKQYAVKMKMPDIYRIHHGSLSKEIREDTERELKESTNLCVFCTNTLELGIDIGNINRTILLAPTWSVASFIQRIGRSGRKDNEAIKFVFLLQTLSITEKSNHIQQLQISLVKSIAIIELYLENYCETNLFNLEDYSCLIHELLAYIAQRGGCSAKQLFDVIIKGSFNEIIGIDPFINLLKYLKENEYIEQFENGDILLTDKSERLVEDFHFYSVFQSPENWLVINNGAVIGELPFLLFYNVGDQILLAGKRWDIVSIEEKNKRIVVASGIKRKDAIFEGYSGHISKEIHQKMKLLYESKLFPNYVDDKTYDLLREAYNYYDIISQNENVIILFQGSRITNTLKAILKTNNIKWQDFEIGIEFEQLTRYDIYNLLKDTPVSKDCFMSIISKMCREEKLQRKYDYLLSNDFIDKMYLKDNLDIEGYELFLNNL